ncbi:MAG TPA: RluA family pseudouridine synthase [Caulobacterales bacterium]|nr:RluA family pseudouridine synthase [Caulobacterales bacterium]
MTERKPRPTLKLAIPRDDIRAPEQKRVRLDRPSTERERVFADPPAPVLSAADEALVKSLLIHEDEHVLAFNKPVGMSVQGGSGIDKSLDDLIVAFSKSNGKKPKLVHRLDRDTSGVIVVARSQPAAAALSKAFAGREAIKTYLAVVCGGPPKPEAAAISIPLKKMARNGIDMVRAARDGDNGVLNAKTRYRTLAKAKEVALVALQPETGRLHQLRAHMSMIDNPIAGDGKYGGLFAIGAVEIPTMMLHAFSLSLPHPAGGMLNVSALPPPAFAQTAAALGLDLSAPLAALAGAR